MILSEKEQHKDFIREYKKFQKQFKNLFWRNHPKWFLEFKDFKDEIFKPIEEYQGFYFISNYGKVVSFKRKLPVERRPKMVADFLTVTLNHFGSSKLHYIHELVYSHFVEKIKLYHRVVHSDNDVSNNYYKNLQEVNIAELLESKNDNKPGDNSSLNLDKPKTLTKTKKSPEYKLAGKTRKTLTEFDVGVLQFSKDGKFVCEFPSILEAALHLGINPKSILDCLKGKTRIAGGFQWRYRIDPNFDDGIFDINPVPRLKQRPSKSICQYDREGNFVREYPSVKDAARAMNITPGAISFSMQKTTRTAGGFKWRLKKNSGKKKNLEVES